MKVAATIVTSAELLECIAAGESQTLEFKASFDKTAIQSLVAFANAQGGRVLVGMSDRGHAIGVTLAKETLNEWLGQIKSATSPALIPDIIAHTIDGKTIVEIDIREFPVKPVNTRGRYYKRVASSNHQLSSSEIADLYMQSLQLSWDAYAAPGFTIAQLSPAKIQRFIRLVNQHGRFALDESDPMAALQKLNYLKNGQLTWAAILLFAEEPIRHIRKRNFASHFRAIARSPATYAAAACRPRLRRGENRQAESRNFKCRTSRVRQADCLHRSPAVDRRIRQRLERASGTVLPARRGGIS